MSMYSSLSLFHSDQRDPFYFTFFFFPFPGPTTHYYFPFPFLSFLLQRVSDLDRHLPIDDFPEDNAPQILDDPIGSSLPHLLGRVRRREPHDLETRSLAGPDARGRVLEDEDRRILAQAQARPPQQVAPRVRLADLDVLRDDKEPGLRELEHLEPAGDQGARAGRDHAPGGARGLQRLEEMPRAGDLDGVLAEFLGDETLYVTDIWRSRMRYKRMNEPVMIKRSFIFFPLLPLEDREGERGDRVSMVRSNLHSQLARLGSYSLITSMLLLPWEVARMTLGSTPSSFPSLLSIREMSQIEQPQEESPIRKGNFFL